MNKINIPIKKDILDQLRRGSNIGKTFKFFDKSTWGRFTLPQEINCKFPSNKEVTEREEKKIERFQIALHHSFLFTPFLKKQRG
jgi:hypothetical protein